MFDIVVSRSPNLWLPTYLALRYSGTLTLGLSGSLALCLWLSDSLPWILPLSSRQVFDHLAATNTRYEKAYIIYLFDYY